MTKPLFQPDAAFDKLGEDLLRDLLDQQAGNGLTREDVSITWMLHDARLTPDGVARIPTGWSWRGDAAFYPCSVVKLFWLLACQARIEAGEVARHDELDRALHDMIRWSSNTATNYVVDLVTGTTGDTLLRGEDYAAWARARNGVNAWLLGLGWPEIDACVNVCQKAADDDRYGRERQFIGAARDNHNSLTTLATARLIQQVFTGCVVSVEGCRSMTDLMRRPIDPEWVATNPHGQVRGYLGAGLPEGARLWSKAGWTTWTGDPQASYRRHDSAYIEAPLCPPFTLVVFTQGRAASEDETMLPAVAASACAKLRRA